MNNDHNPFLNLQQKFLWVVATCLFSSITDMALRLTSGQLASSLTYCFVAFLLFVGMYSCQVIYLKILCFNLKNPFNLLKHPSPTIHCSVNPLKFCIFFQLWWWSGSSLWTDFEGPAWFSCTILGQCVCHCQGLCLEVLFSSSSLAEFASDLLIDFLELPLVHMTNTPFFRILSLGCCRWR